MYRGYKSVLGFGTFGHPSFGFGGFITVPDGIEPAAIGCESDRPDVFLARFDVCIIVFSLLRFSVGKECDTGFRGCNPCVALLLLLRV